MPTSRAYRLTVAGYDVRLTVDPGPQLTHVYGLAFYPDSTNHADLSSYAYNGYCDAEMIGLHLSRRLVDGVAHPSYPVTEDDVTAALEAANLECTCDDHPDRRPPVWCVWCGENATDPTNGNDLCAACQILAERGEL